MRRSIGAIAIGFLFIALCSIGTDVAVRALLPTAFTAGGATTSVPVLLLTLAYVGVFAVSGCWLTARLAPDRPMWHAMVLGWLGLAFNVVGTWAAWDTAPAWYHATALALVLPYAWIGGRLRVRQLRAGDGPRLRVV